MLGLAPDARILDVEPRDPRARRARRRAAARPRRCSTSPTTASSWRWSTPGWAPARRLVGGRGRRRRADRARQRPARAGGGDGRRRPLASCRSTTPSTTCPRRARPSPGVTCWRPRPATSPPAPSSPSSGARSTRRRLVPGLVSLPEVRDDGAIVGEVWWVDRFGNCQLNVDPDELARRWRAAGGARRGAAVRRRSAPRAGSHTYADAKPSELVLLVDSYGLLSLALDRESAASRARVARRERRHPGGGRRPRSTLDRLARSGE